jgi:hypothetical protein
MNKLIIICLLFPASALLLFSQSLKIADSIVFKIPEGWNYVDSKKQLLSGLGVLNSAILENSAESKQLMVSLLSVGDPVPSVQYPTELVEATLSPWIEAYRKKGSHYYPRKLLWQGNYLFYSQEVGRLQAKKVELRGVLFKSGNDWVNFFCIGPREISWKQYGELINGTKLLN